MPARRLQIGEHGSVAYVTGPTGRVTASMYYRNGQGRRRRIEATADSKTAAHREAVKAFERAMAMAGGVSFSSRTTFRDVAAEWFERFEQLVRDGRRSPASASLYRATLDRHVLPVIGGLRLAELTNGARGRIPARCAAGQGPCHGEGLPLGAVRGLRSGGAAGRAAVQPGS